MTSTRLIIALLLALGISSCVGWMLVGKTEGGSQRHGIGVSVPSDWKPLALDGIEAPGKLMAAWESPSEVRLVAYRTLHEPGGTASSLLRDLETRLSNLPRLAILKAGTTQLAGGTEAAYIEAIAPGTGQSLASSALGVPQGSGQHPLVATHILAVGIPGREHTLWLAWHGKESTHASWRPSVEAIMRGLTGPAPITY